MKIVLISCVSKKLDYKAKAKDLYISPLFRFNLRYAKSLNPDKILILSAKYGLVGLGDEIEPYDLTLNNMAISERKEWAESIVKQLDDKMNFENDEVILINVNVSNSKKYREYLIPKIKNYKIPMKGLSIGRQLQFLKNELS